MPCDNLIHLSYTIYDDGVWAFCSKCDFEKNLGFEATYKDVYEAQCRHNDKEENDNGQDS